MSLKKISLNQLRDIKQQGIGVLLSGIVLNLAISLLLSFGSYSLYLSLSLSTSPITFSIIFPLMYITANAMIPFGSAVITKKYFRAIVSCLLVIIGCGYLSLAQAQTALGSCLILTLLVALPTGLLYTIPSQCALKYFPSSIASINGGMQGAQGIGCAIFAYIIHYCSNNQNREILISNESYFEANGFEIQGTMNAIAVMMGLGAAFVVWHIRYPKRKGISKIDLNTKLLLDYEMLALSNLESKRQLTGPSSDREAATVEQGSSSAVNQPPSNPPSNPPSPPPPILPAATSPAPTPPPVNHFTPCSQCKFLYQGLFSCNFFLLTLMGTITMNGFFLMSNYKYLSISIDQTSDRKITLFACLGFLMFGLMRMITRWLVTHLGFQKLFLLCLLTNTTSTLGYLLPANPTLLGITLTLGLLTLGCLFTWFTLYTTKLFGYGLAAKFIQTLLITFAVGSLAVHGVWVWSKSVRVIGWGLMVGNLVALGSYMGVKENVIW